MEIALAVQVGFLLDLLLGDPRWMPHPVVLMGKAITGLEKRLRGVFPKTSRGELGAGVVLAVLLPVCSGGIALLALWLVGQIHPALRFALDAFWCWQALAVKDLKDESMAVCRRLQGQDLPGARKAVSRIVGRDTEALSAEGVTKAAVETVAENTSDGVISPLFFLAIGGAPLGLAYKAINTMDSMVGYKNDRYLYFGRAAARLDDAANFLPARLAALMMIVSAGLPGFSLPGAWRIWRRDRFNQPSPNAAQCEAACAGALGVQLGGPARYFGKPVEKKTIGDPLRPIEPADIRRANVLLYATSVLALLVFVGVRVLAVLLV